MKTKYVNEMEDYLYNHNYISENNNDIKQKELSVLRASCIVQKYRTLTEEKDKEIESLKGKLERINCLVHKAINEREINGVGNLNLHEILELSGSDDNE